MKPSNDSGGLNCNIRSDSAIGDSRSNRIFMGREMFMLAFKKECPICKCRQLDRIDRSFWMYLVPFFRSPNGVLSFLRFPKLPMTNSVAAFGRITQAAFLSAPQIVASVVQNAGKRPSRVIVREKRRLARDDYRKGVGASLNIGEIPGGQKVAAEFSVGALNPP
jgi:hypothetical protein